MSRAALSGWRQARTTLGYDQSFRGRLDATGLHWAGSRRGHLATCGEVVLLRAMVAAPTAVVAAAATTQMLPEVLLQHEADAMSRRQQRASVLVRRPVGQELGKIPRNGEVVDRAPTHLYL